MSLKVSVLKRSHSVDQFDLAISSSPCKKRKASPLDNTDQNLILISDAKSQIVAQKKLPLTPVNSPPVSPQKLGTPMKYHNYEDITREKLKQLKKFKNKESHTLSPASTESNFRHIQQNFPKLRSIQRELDAEADRAKLQFGQVAFEVAQDEISVFHESKKSTFGVHEVSMNGAKQKRAYPKSGDGVVTLPGLQVFELVQSYKKTPRTMSFQAYVAQNIENIPPTK